MTESYIIGVIVTFHPNPEDLKNLINSVHTQVDQLFVIDNGSPNFPEEIGTSSITNLNILRNEKNLGLSTAYNQAIEHAKLRGATHLILFDQDSLPAEGMIETLFHAMQTANSDVLRAVAAGPKFHDKKGQKLSPFVRIKDYHLERVDCEEGQVVEIDHLISSGSLIDMRAFDQVGNFVDGLFIDCVDTEWCLRARAKNLLILGVGSASMRHNIGEAYLKIFNRELPLHSPHRLYYQFRNQLWIMKQPWVSWRWRIIDGIRCIKLMIVFIFFAPNKRKNLAYMMKGIRDGILSRMGRLEI